jgi:hypothetical protein
MARLHPAYTGDSGGAAARPPAWKIPLELVRSFVLAYVIARLAVGMGVAGWTGALQLGVLLWIGFPFVLWTGAMMWENVPPKLAAIHAGDWLAKLLLIAVIVGVWRR